MEWGKRTMMRIRKLSPTERFYVACTDLFSPFAIQLLLSAEHLPSVAELEKAMKKVADANPSIRFEIQGRWWVDANRLPQVRIYKKPESNIIDSPLLKEKIACIGPSCEVVVWKDRGLLFRATHSLMDAGGLLFWVEEITRALRCDELLGSSFSLSDNDFLKSLNHRVSRKSFRFNCQPISSATNDINDGFAWSHHYIPGHYPAYVAKLAQKIAAANAGKNHYSLFMVPVDLRRMFPAIRTTMNFSNPLFLQLEGTEEWQQIYQFIVLAINNKAYLAIDWKDKWIMALPNVVLKRLVKYLHKYSIENHYFALSGVLSHVGTVSLSSLSTSNFKPGAACFMPLDIPGSAISIVSVQHEHGLEVTQSRAEKFSAFDVNLSQDCLYMQGKKKSWDYDKENIYELVAEQAKKHPRFTAVSQGHEQWCYQVLIEKATQVHGALAELNIGQGDIVAIVFKRSFALLATVLGVLRAGAAFLPIDTAWPADRQEFILQNALATALVSDIEHRDKVKHPVKLIWEHLSPATNAPAPVHGQLAYILYTSGSTGLPKGIKIGQVSLRNYFLWARDTYQSNKDEALCFPFFTSLVFDLTITSIFLPWLTKGQVKIIDSTTLLEQASVILQDKEINAIKLTPSHLSIFNELGFAQSTIQKMIVGGEALSTALVNTSLKQKNNISIFNEYGPTEATIGCMVHLFDPINDKLIWVPIGKPIANSSILLKPTDLSSSILEMYLSGHCLAMGYLGNAALKHSNFLPHPDIINERVYRSGDMASVNASGELVYHGRLDDQLKIRGHRIELGEIEACILDSALTTTSAVIVDEGIGMQLIAYVVWKDKIVLNELMSFLENKLPVYMIPAQIITIGQLPLTINGKVDRQILVNHFKENFVLADTKVVEQSIYSTQLSSMLTEILGEKSIKIDRHHSLLEHGVDSLAISLLLARILKRYFSSENNLHIFFNNTDFMYNPTLELLEMMIIKEIGATSD